VRVGSASGKHVERASKEVTPLLPVANKKRALDANIALHISRFCILMKAPLRLAEQDVSRKLTHKVSGFAPREVSATRLFIKAGDVVRWR
jgi:hypothetical protein